MDGITKAKQRGRQIWPQARMPATYAGSWGLLDQHSTDMSRLLANAAVMDPGSCMDDVCNVSRCTRCYQPTLPSARQKSEECRREEFS